MPLQTLELTNFRSYRANQFELGPEITLVVGPNASGKTNLLESIYVLAVAKSFRAKDTDLVRHGENHFRISAQTDAATLSLGYQNVDGKQEKRVAHDGAKKSINEHLGVLQVTLFEPNDLQLVSGPPEGRRRYLDFILCLTDRSYLSALQQYRRVLRQRNSLLADFALGAIQSQIFAWDVQLTDLAQAIFAKRQRLVAHINQLADGIYTEIAGAPVDLQLTYLASVEADDYAGSFMQALQNNLTRDLAAGFTTIGPHREDFQLRFGASSLGSVASRGETRTAVLVLKLAEMDYVQQATGKSPILLLDDVFSELDHTRRQFLLQRLDARQTIITTTEADTVSGEVKDFTLIETSEVVSGA